MELKTLSGSAGTVRDGIVEPILKKLLLILIDIVIIQKSVLLCLNIKRITFNL